MTVLRCPALQRLLTLLQLLLQLPLELLLQHLLVALLQYLLPAVLLLLVQSLLWQLLMLPLLLVQLVQSLLLLLLLLQLLPLLPVRRDMLQSVVKWTTSNDLWRKGLRQLSGGSEILTLGDARILLPCEK